MNPEDIIAAATAYAAQWAEGYGEGQPRPWDGDLEYDEEPVGALEALVERACACGCGPMRVYYAARTLYLPTDYSPSDVPSELVKYVAALVEQYRAVTS